MKNNETKTTITEGKNCQNLTVNEIYLQVNDIYLKDCSLANQILRSSVAHIMEATERGATALLSIAYHLAVIEKTGAYKDDGYKNTVDFAKAYLGYKNSYASALVKIGKRNMVFENGRTMFCPNAGTKDFTAKHLELMCPLDNATLLEMVEDGTLSPYMSTKEVAEKVRYRKALLNNEIVESEAEEKKSEPATEEVEATTVETQPTDNSENDRIKIIDFINKNWGKITFVSIIAKLDDSACSVVYNPENGVESCETAIVPTTEEPTPN